jgi:hypothetical protein
MGGLIRAPKPAVPADDPDAAAAAQRKAAATEADADAAAQDARRRAMERARRGLAGTIVTSARGVLDPAPGFAVRKNLLGE